MLVSNNVFKNRYVWDGSQTNFPISFPFLDNNHIQVWYAKPGEPDTDAVILGKENYTITGAGNPVGGVLTRTTAWAVGATIAIVRNVPITQLHQYTQYDNFPAESHEDALAKLTMICQQLDEICSRAITVPITSEKTPQEYWQYIHEQNQIALEAIFHARDQVLDGLTFAGNTTGATMVVADKTTTPRSISDRFADIINIKDFGAKGDGVTDDTEAWERWQTALEKGGIGYIPSGQYRVNGIIRSIVQGCFGNGVDHVMDASVYQGDGSSGMRERAFANHMGTIGPVIQQYREYTGKESWGPMVDLSFESVCDGNFDWTEYGSGAQGIQVRGSAKGMGNSHPICIRGFMQNRLNGDGDAVAIWGRCQKEDPADGINNSDTCAIHSAVYNESKGSGLIMASEHWAIVGENGGTEQTNGAPAGATICQHVKAFSSKGMAHAGILISGGMDNYPYGMWNAIQISRGAFMRNGSMDGIPGTTAFKCDSWFQDLGYPDIGWHVGYCPNHIKTIGAYPFNITGDSLRIKNNTDGGNASVIINKVSGTGTAGIVLQVDDTSQNDIYVEKGNPNTFYRARQSASSHHLFFCTDASGTLSNALSVGTVAVNPGTDGTIASGWSNKRWSHVYASTGTIETSDERLKEDIRPIDESVFKAWGKVEFRQFLFKDAVAEKGSAARIHIGLIAQQVIAAFASEGLDAMRYGIVCYDKWDAQEAVTERFKVVTREETHNEDGSVKEPEEFHYEERILTPAKEAGDCYSIRYEEALALECAYQRWLGERRDARISALELMDGVA